MEAVMAFHEFASEIMQPHSLCILLVQAVTKFCLVSRGENTDAHLLMEECQGSCVKTACGIGNILMQPSQKCYLKADLVSFQILFLLLIIALCFNILSIRE